MAEVLEGTKSFTDTNLDPTTTYAYTVSAVDDEGNEGTQSDPDDATTQEEPVEELHLDGSEKGTLTNQKQQEIDSAFSDALEDVQIYWTGWWPVLHYVWEDDLIPGTIPEDNRLKPLEGQKVGFHIAKNLLGQDEISELSIPDDVTFEIQGEEAEDLLVTNVALKIVLYSLWFTGAIVEALFTGGHAILGGIAIATGVLIGAYAFHLLYELTVRRLRSGSWDAAEAAANWFLVGIEALAWAIGGGIGTVIDIFTGGWGTIIAYGIAEWASLKQAFKRCIFGIVFMFAWALCALMMASLLFLHYVTGTPVNI